MSIAILKVNFRPERRKVREEVGKKYKFKLTEPFRPYRLTGN